MCKMTFFFFCIFVFNNDDVLWGTVRTPLMGGSGGKAHKDMGNSESNSKDVRWNFPRVRYLWRCIIACILIIFFGTVNLLSFTAPTAPAFLTKRSIAPVFLRKRSRLRPSNLTKWPAEWLITFSAAELEESAREAKEWKGKALNAMKHAYGAYRRPGVYGSDTVSPMTGLPGKTWGFGAYTMIDSLSTLWLMGMYDEFNEAAKWIEKNLHFNYEGYVSVFETIIRELGGLLSAYALSKYPIFRTKAHELGDKLMPAFVNTLPATQISLATGKGKPGWFRGSLLSEVTTLQLEFRYLSEITGDPKFREKGDAAMNYILKHGGNDGLVPNGWQYPPLENKGPVNTEISFGARSDSYYEYLLKTYIQNNKKEPQYLLAWQRSMTQMKERLVRRSGNDYAVVVKEASFGERVDEMDHLACFVGGMLVMADVALEDNDKNGYMSLGKNITAACFEMYKKHKTGLAPEIFQWNDGVVGPGNLEAKWDARHNLLRPETAESIFYLFYYTGDPAYRRMAGHIIDAFEKETRCPFGYCSIKDVVVSPPTKVDDMESFFLAETLKYLYLTFVTVPKDVLDLDAYVLNTEAHPIPRLQS